jgi:hypothetical protein
MGSDYEGAWWICVYRKGSGYGDGMNMGREADMGECLGRRVVDMRKCL